MAICACGAGKRWGESVKKWNDLVYSDRVDKIAGVVQWVCLLVVAMVELLFFLPGEAADSIVYAFLEWKLVDVAILFLAASFFRKQLLRSRGYFLFALLTVLWFYVVRAIHLGLEGTNQNPGAFICAYLLCFPFAAAVGDGKRMLGLKALAAVFMLVGAAFGFFAVLLVTGRLPAFLDGYVYWDGPRFGTMGHPNLCATVLMISIGLTVGFALRAKRRRIKFPLLALAALEFWAISLTNSRTAIVLTCAMLGGILICLLRRPGWKGLVPAFAAALAAMALLFCVSRTIFSWNNARLKDLAVEAQQTGEEIGLTLNEDGTLKTQNTQASFADNLKTLNSRTWIWSVAVDGLRNNPRILLFGTENVRQTVFPEGGSVQHTHNAWLETLYRLGIPGLLAALALSVLAVWDGAVLLWRNDDLLHSCVAMTALCLMGCALLEPYLFTVSAQFHYFDFLFLLSLGYLDQWRMEKEGEKWKC